MAKLSLKALGIILKKISVLAKNYTDLKVSANSVHLYEKATANTGYLKTYILSTAANLASVVAGNTIGEIDIPKDFLVKSGKLLSVIAGTGDNAGKFMVTHENGTAVATQYEAPTGVTAAGQWIDLVINSKDGDATDSHICFDVTKLVDIYSNGDGLNLSNGQFSIKLNATASGLEVDGNGLKVKLGSNTNGLSITSNGLELATATASNSGVGGSNGAMSAVDKENLDDLVDDMELDLLTNAEMASWFGYDITGTPAAGSDAASVKSAIEAVSTDSITDEA